MQKRYLFSSTILVFIIFFWALPTLAEMIVDTAWVRRYSGPGNSFDWAQGIAVDGSGNVYVTGYSWNGTNHDCATIKYYPNGDTAWVRRYNGPGDSTDYSTAITVDGSGNVYVTGYSYETVAAYDYITIKYYSNGDTAWVRTYNGPGNSGDYAYAIAVDGSGNVCVTGHSLGSGTVDDYATIKYYPNGDTAWVRRYDGLGNSSDYPTAMVVDGSGNVYVTGWSSGLGTGDDYVTIKYQPNGDTAWVRRYDGLNSTDDARDLVVDVSGNVYVTGSSYSNSKYSSDFATVKYLPNGDTAWVRTYNGPGNSGDYASTIAMDSSGNVYITGESSGSGSGYDCTTIKYYPNGDTAWVRRYNGPANSTDFGWDLTVDGSGNVYVTGASIGIGTSNDYATIRYYPNGDTAWVRIYNGPGNSDDYAYVIAIDGFGNVYVTGYSVGSGTGYDYATIKYSQNIGCEFILLSPGPSQSGHANTQVSILFSIQNLEVSTDTFDLHVSDNLGWSIVPNHCQLAQDPGQVDTVVFVVSIPYVPSGTIDSVRLDAVSRTDSTVYCWAYLTVTSTGRTIHVPADFSGIQSAINSSADYDSILVAPGIYHEHINFNGKTIVLKSEKGSDSTIISKLSGGVCMVSFISGEDSNSVLDGFTLTGAILEFGYGAGIKCVSSSPKIINNKIINNRCPLGAGIACEDHANPIITNNIIRQNNAGTEGAGIRCNIHSSPLIQQNVIVENTVTGNGGGILCLNNSSPVIIGNLLAKNLAQNGYGGGISLQNSSSAAISNNTLDRNSALYGGGVYIDATSSASVVNTIITNTPSGKGIRADWLNPLVIYYCDVWNNLDEDFYGCVPGTGSISINPLFCDTGSTDYSLWISSPCLGSGQNGSNIGAFGMGCSVMGDANGDAVIDVGDVVYLINYLFKSGPAPSPLPAGDATCDGKVDVGDVVYLINYLFKSGPAPSC